MSKVVALMSMSLDGYVADREDGVAEVFAWYFSGDVEFHTGGADPMTFTVSAPSAEHLRSLVAGLGAMLTGRRTFDKAHGWNGNHAWGPSFVLTHQIPGGWPQPSSTVHFVTDGVESAVRQAKAAAGGKNVGVHGADTIQQLLNAGLLDEIQVDIVALLLGAGMSRFATNHDGGIAHDRASHLHHEVLVGLPGVREQGDAETTHAAGSRPDHLLAYGLHRSRPSTAARA